MQIGDIPYFIFTLSFRYGIIKMQIINITFLSKRHLVGEVSFFYFKERSIYMHNEVKTTEELLQEKLDKLRNNKEHCSEEELKGKYAKAYNTLLAEIEELKLRLISEEIFNICIPIDCVEESKTLVKKLLKEANKDFYSALYIAYSTEELKKKYQEIREKILEALFNHDINWSSAERYDLLGRRLL